MSKKRMNLVYGEKYGDANDPKTRWTKVGSLFIDDEDGRMSVKIDAIPVGKYFDGWLAVFEPRDFNAEGDGQNAPASNSKANPAAGASGTEDDGDKPIDLSEIPF
jgi:hypothetical protein